MLELTAKAIEKIKELLAAEKKVGYGLRVVVQGGGCSGFQYGLTWENETKENDNVMEFDGLRVYVDATSGMYMDGVKIDFVETEQGTGFKIENPNATGTCGCGSSC